MLNLSNTCASFLLLGLVHSEVNKVQNSKLLDNLEEYINKKIEMLLQIDNLKESQLSSYVLGNNSYLQFLQEIKNLELIKNIISNLNISLTSLMKFLSTVNVLKHKSLNVI